MAGVNKVILIGNLGADPDVRYMPSNEAVTNISVATSETWNDRNTGEKREKTEWHRVVAFRKLGELIGQYCRKGSKVYIEGKLQTRRWTDQNGLDRYTTEIIADQVQFLDSRSTQGGYDGSDQGYMPPVGRNGGQNNNYGGNQGSYAPPQNHNSQYGGSHAPSAPIEPKSNHFDDLDDGFDKDIPF